MASKAVANLVTDARLAALAVEHGCELASTDSDFSRFPGLKWKNPIASLVYQKTGDDHDSG
jgi:predicted nucleic acid-binding protein